MIHHDHSRHRGGESAGARYGHAPAGFGSAFLIGITLNVVFVAIEAVFGILGNSIALLADAGHNLSDALGLVVAWLASVLSRRAPTGRFTYGLRGSSILAALFNAMFLLFTAGALSWEAVQRFQSPEPVAGYMVMAVAGAGILINGATAWLFFSGRTNDINIRGAFLHMLADALVSAGVVAAGLLIIVTGRLWLDPAVSLAINAVVVWSTWSLLKESFAMSLAAVPPHLDPVAIKTFLSQQPKVKSVHDLHVWSMSTTEVALTCHLVMADGHPGDPFLHTLAEDLRERFGINHPTFQIEINPGIACALAPADVV